MEINVYDSINVSEWNSHWLIGARGMAGLPFRCIDIMGMTKDTLDSNVSAIQSDDVIQAIADDFNVTHVGVSIPMNTNAEAIADRGYAFDSEPGTYAAQFCDKIHSAGLKVLWRGTDCTFEAGGLYYMTPDYSKRNGNRYTYFADTIEDKFNTNTIGNYYTDHQSGNDWSISGGTLHGPAGDGWRRTCLFLQEFDAYKVYRQIYLNNMTMQAKVKKVGNQQIVCRATTDTNYPGYGLQMRTGELRIESPGRYALGNVSKTFVEGNWYWLKMECNGSSIKGKVWADGSAEPGTWDISVTDTYQTYGYCGFSGESDYGEFDDMTITPIKDTDTWLARACDWLHTNIALFETGDIIAPYPEADAHQSLGTQGGYNSFMSEMKYCIERLFAEHGLVVYGGYVSQNFTGVIQGGRGGEMFSIPHMQTVDHYGSCLGLNERFSSGPSASQTNVAGTDTYTVPLTLSEVATAKCSFIPEKIAINQDIDVYVVNKGTGDWTMTIHNEYNQPVQLPDHTNYSSKTNSYIATKSNASITNNAWNTFTCYWDNPDCDHTYHFHLTSTVADGTVRVLSGHSGDMEYCGHEQFKTNATADAIEIDLREIYAKNSEPVFLQEWGDFWSLDSGRSTPVRTEAQHTEYLKTMYDAFTRLANDGILLGFNYWRATGGYEQIMYDADPTAGYNYQPNYAGMVYLTYLSTVEWYDEVGVSEAVTVVMSVAGTHLINVNNNIGVQDVVQTIPPEYLVISAGDTLDQSQPLGNTYAGFGEYSGTRYRGMGFKTTGTSLTAISFELYSTGTYGMKVYIDTADADSIPEHAVGSELYSWEIPNAQLSAPLKKYSLPTPLSVTPATQYCFYLAPWNTTTHAYADDYRDPSWQNANVYANGKPIGYSSGAWWVSDSGNFDMRFEIYTAGGPSDANNVSESVTVSLSEESTAEPLSISVVAKGIVIVG